MMFVRIVGLTLCFALIAVFGFVLLFRSSQSPLNPFLPYADILTRQIQGNTVAARFGCPSEVTIRCSYRSTDPVFSNIDVLLVDKKVQKISFEVHPNRLIVGNLALLWGQPEVTWTGSQPYLSWPDRGVKAFVLASSRTRQLDFYAPVWSVHFDL